MGLPRRSFAFILFVFFLQFGLNFSLANDQSILAPNQIDDLQKDIAWKEGATVDLNPLASPVTSALQFLLALGSVVALAYLVLHKGLGSILKRQRSGEIIKIRERLTLDGKHSLFVVDINGQSLLLATSEKGVQVVLPSLPSKEA